LEAGMGAINIDLIGSFKHVKIKAITPEVRYLSGSKTPPYAFSFCPAVPWCKLCEFF